MSDTEVDVTDQRSKLDSGCEDGEPQLTPEMLASLEKMTNISQSCAKQLRSINEAIERVLDKQNVVDDLALILEEYTAVKR